MVLALLALTSCVLADGTPVSYGVALTSGGESFNLRTSLKIYEIPEVPLFGLTITNFSIHADSLYTPETNRWGGGISARAEKIGIEPIDRLLDIARIDGVGFGAIVRELPFRFNEIDWVVYAVSDVRF